MKILLAKCPRVLSTHFPDNTESLALGYLASSLRDANFFADILDASILNLSIEDTVKVINSKNYSLIGFTISDPTFLESTLLVSRLIKEKNPAAHITIGGHTPTFHAQEILFNYSEINSIIMYEGERPIVDLATALSEQRTWKTIPNLATRIGSEVIINPPRPLIKDLDSIPFPARDVLPQLMERRPDIGVVSVASSRGCFRNCSFCSIRAFYKEPTGPPWRTRSVSNIIQEIEELYKNFQIREIAFVDDIFFGTGEKARNQRILLADKLIKRNLPISLALAVSVKEVDEEIFSKLYDAGLRQVLLGIESSSQKILNYFSKGTTPDDGINAVGILHEIGIDPVVSFINFTPETTLQDLRDNLCYFKKLKVNFLQGLLNRLQVYKGTDIERKLKIEGILLGTPLNPYYEIKDKRVETIYHICTKSLGKFLSIAYEIKRVERAYRLQIFALEHRGRDIHLLLKRRQELAECVDLILEECSSLFNDVINFSETNFNPQKIESYVKIMKKRLTISYEEWMQVLDLFLEDVSKGDKNELQAFYSN